MINGQAKLTGLKVSEPRTLTPPAQLLNKNNPQPQDIQVELLPEPDKKEKSALGVSDNLSAKINLASSGIAGGIAGYRTAQNVGVIGESLRGMQVQGAMADMQARTMGGQGYGGYNTGGYNNYNSNSYGTDYSGYNSGYNTGYNTGYNGSPEYVSRYGRSEALYGRRYGGIEDYSGMNGNYGPMGRMNSPEMQMANRNILNGALSGVKLGSLIGGGVSALVNGYNVVTGKATGKEAMGSVAADTVTAGVSAGVGALGAGFSSLWMGMAGVGGMTGLVLSSGVGIVGAVAGQYLLQKSGIYDSIKEKVMNMFGDKK
jgi:hypothetical protein